MTRGGRGRSGGGRAQRSARTGRYISKRTAKRSPRTTLSESRTASRSSGTRYRSAITGRYVSRATAERHPDTTVAER